MQEVNIDILGWVGVILVLLAYGLSYTKYLGHGITYRAMNFFGSCMIAVASFYDGMYSVMVLNIIWALISMLAFVKSK